MGKPNICDFLKARPIKSNGGFAQYVALDYRMVYPLPDKLPDELAPFIEPLSCALYTTNVANASSKDKVAIFGGGLMGLLTALIMQKDNLKTCLIEPSEYRRDFVKNLLHINTYSPKEFMDSELVGDIDIVIDCSGSAHAIAQAIDILRKAGRLIISGIVMNSKNADISFLKVTTKLDSHKFLLPYFVL